MGELRHISGRNHFVLLHHVDREPNSVIPILWLFSDGEPRVFHPLLDYFKDNPGHRLDWKRKAARSVGLFYDFCLSFQFDNTNSIRNIHSAALHAFIEAIQKGTIPKEGVDNSGLYWAPMSANSVAVTARHIDQFVEYACDKLRDLHKDHPLKALYREFSAPPSNQAEMVGFLIASKSNSSRSFLQHLKNNEVSAKGLHRASRRNLGYEQPVSGLRSAKHMDPSLIAKMLEVGFVKNENAVSIYEKEDVTAKMIFLLLVGGGLRQSEPLHMWFNDFAFPLLDGNERCIPLLRHPSQAETYIMGESCSRREYLGHRGLVPRYEAGSKALWVGWKNLPMDQRTAQTEVFFIHQGLEYLFASYFRTYLNFRRELVHARIRRGESDHPFLFVSKGEDRSSASSCIGNPYSLSAFKRAWTRALDRVEKAYGEVVPRGKIYGTTPHGLRHFYGKTLLSAGAPQKAIQRAMHHRHILSQSVYTEPEWQEVNEALNRARSNARKPLSNFTTPMPDPYDETAELKEQWRF
ncbi:site-specific integrase [Aliiroseovarius crassostreae]|uniref:site-specific integrase n=1 Tax=Aliiroseovarius crassostreae TaxID=154981 RepID=UPI0022004896|nr:site-specific integrase [Aliiroseovarius crassostreae]UWP88445.1 site-specific integrase [Aliiroseovarius crassostreae]